MKGNALVKAGSLFLVVVLVLIVVNKSGEPDQRNSTIPDEVVLDGGEPVSEETLAALGLEADTEQDTVRTLIGEVRKLKADISSLRQDNADLRQDNSQLRAMEDTISKRVTNKINRATREQETYTRQRLDMLSNQANNKYRELISRVNQNKGSQQIDSNEILMGSQGTVWIAPLGQVLSEGDKTTPHNFLSSLTDTGNPQAGKNDRFGIDKLPGKSKRNRTQKTIDPVYTVPKNATLVGSTALTALVGRVPVGSNVVDPYSFKIIIGKDNLAANGLEIPELAHAVTSGKAIGDWTLGCVRGELHSITFVFQDGTIRTIPKPKNITDGSNRTQEVPIGELADNFGNPCVVGKRITNAHSYLAQRIGVSAAAAAAEAAAASETTTLTTSGGGGIGTTTVVDGNKADFILGRTLADGAQEVANWLDERQSQHFDAIYVPPGETVAIHITEEIRIDYDRAGRRTHHSDLAQGGIHRALD